MSPHLAPLAHYPGNALRWQRVPVAHPGGPRRHPRAHPRPVLVLTGRQLARSFRQLPRGLCGRSDRGGRGGGGAHPRRGGGDSALCGAPRGGNKGEAVEATSFVICRLGSRSGGYSYSCLHSQSPEDLSSRHGVLGQIHRSICTLCWEDSLVIPAAPCCTSAAPAPDPRSPLQVPACTPLLSLRAPPDPESSSGQGPPPQ